MDEEYEIIFIPDEGRAILNKKTKKVYYSEFEIVEEKNDKIDKLQSNWNSLREWLEKNIKEKPLLTTYFFECDGKQKSISGIELEELKRVLDKMNELEGVGNEQRQL